MPPNILWIVMEDTSPRLGCYGDDLAATPRIDDLAAEGRRFDRMFSTTGVCAPSRASLVTGMLPQSLGAQHMRTETHDVDGLVDPYRSVPPHYVTAVSEYLRKAGYYCTLDYKTDFQFGEPLTMWDRHARGAGWWDAERDPDQPFFSMMTNTVTHESGMWEPSMTGSKREGGLVHNLDTDPDAVRVPPYLADTEGTRKAIARQYDNIASADAWIGDLLDRLAADGHVDDTIVLLVGDHGEGLPRKKRWPYDSGTHVPLIVRSPGETSGGASERMVSGVDIAPTTLALAGIRPPRYMDGVPFLGPMTEDRSYVFTTRDRTDESYDMIRSVRDERFRYVRQYFPEKPFVQYVPYRDRHPAMKALLRKHAHDSLDAECAQWFASSRPAEELYDLSRDPDELHNIVDEEAHADTLDRLRRVLDRRFPRTARFEVETEAQMRRRIWPHAERPQTTKPTFVVHGPGGTLDRVATGEELEGPISVDLYCPTQGASLTWAVDGDRWTIYNGPMQLSAGTTAEFRARAVRYGFDPSSVARRSFKVV